MSADPDPEIATNEDWRGIMVKARKDLEMTQAELAAKIGTSQNTISLIESGEISSSSFIMPICRELKIATPQHFADDDQKAWSHLGTVLRNKNMKKYRRYIALLESEIEEEDVARTAANNEKGTPGRK